MTSPMFSVVIPTHNRIDMLRRALQSVVAQTCGDYEVVVVDDGSTDSTPAFLAAVPDTRWHPLRNAVAGGASAARNAGVAAAQGEFVVFLDDDDELRPNALETLKHYLQTFPQLTFLWGGRLIREKDAAGRMVSTRAELWPDGTAGVHGATFLPYVLEVATNCAFTIRRSVFNELGGFDEQLRVSEDRDLFLSLAEADYMGCSIPQILIDVDQHFVNSLSRNVGVTIGPDIDLRVITKHRRYLERPELRKFVNEYLLTIYAGYLQANKRKAAMSIAAELYKYKGLDLRALRKYLRHAPEFRALKGALGYSSLRRLKHRLSLSLSSS